MMSGGLFEHYSFPHGTSTMYFCFVIVLDGFIFLVFHSDSNFENWHDHDFQLGRIQSNQFNRMECINIY